MSRTTIRLCLLLLSTLAFGAFSARAEEGYWRFAGERLVKGKPFLVGPNDPTRVEASGGGSSLSSVYSQRQYRSSATFTWTASAGLSRLVPGTKIKFTGTLTHSGNGDANAGISLQPYGQEPGTGGPNGQGIVAGFDGTSGRSTTRSAEFVVPDGSLFPDKKMELRFEVRPGGASSAVYRTYEWVAGANPPAEKPPAKDKPVEKTKPAKPPKPPEKVDIHIDPDLIALAYTSFDEPGWFHQYDAGAPDKVIKTKDEPRADIQAFTVRVKNLSPKVTARNVQLEMFAQRPGESERTPVSKDAVGDIPPGESKDFADYISLGNQNIESATLFFRVSTPGQEEVNEEDNTAGVEFSVWFAAQDGRVFSVHDDTYSFPNYGWEEREGEEFLEGFLATVLGGMKLDGHLLNVMQRLWFAGAWLDFAGISVESWMEGMGGHCYGMSATSAIYFEEPNLRPVPKAVPDMIEQDASYNINLYQRAQMLPVFSAMVDRKLLYDFYPNPTRAYEDIKASLRDKRQALIAGFSSDPAKAGVFSPFSGHAVLAYKLLEVSGRNPLIYVYDSNFPAGPGVLVDPPYAGMEHIEVNLSKDEYRYRKGNYDWESGKHLLAFRPHRKMPLDATSTRLINVLKEVYGRMIKSLNDANEQVVVVKCPADAVFTDAKGRRTGVLNGKVYQEIPGSKVVTQGEVEMYRLPEDGTYSLTIRGTGKGKMSLDIIRAAGPKEAKLVSFADVPVDAKTVLSGKIDGPSAVKALSTGSRAIEPAVIGAMKGDRATWEKAPAKFDVPPPPNRTSFLVRKSAKPARPTRPVSGLKPKFEFPAKGVKPGKPASPAGGAESYAGVSGRGRQDIFLDAFDDNRAKWVTGTVEDGKFRLAVESGHYSLRSLDANHKSAWRNTGIDTSRDFEIETRIKHVSGPADQGQGLIWGASDGKNAFHFSFAPKKHFKVYKWQAGKAVDITPWKKTDLVDPDDYVVLTVRKAGSTLYFFLNKTLVHRMPFEPFFGNRIGFSTGRNSAIKVDYLKVAYLN